MLALCVRGIYCIFVSFLAIPSEYPTVNIFAFLVLVTMCNLSKSSTELIVDAGETTKHRTRPIFGSRWNLDFSHIMMTCFIGSTIAQASYTLSKISAHAELAAEIFFLTFQSSNEAVFGRLKTDILAHHCGMLFAFLMVSFHSAYTKWAFLVVNMQSIHIPLIFLHARNLAKSASWKSFWEAPYHICWFSAVTYRCSTVLYNVYIAHRSQDPASKVILVGAILVLSLDALWTKQLLRSLSDSSRRAVKKSK